LATSVINPQRQERRFPASPADRHLENSNNFNGVWRRIQRLSNIPAALGKVSQTAPATV
jgi:hypothetical protein